jgi:hypothetical protein
VVNKHIPPCLQCCSICCSTIFTPCGSSAVKSSSNSQTFDLERIKHSQSVQHT